MMLIFKEETSCSDISINIDEYVPFTVEIETGGISSSPLYWRGGDGKRSLVEIGLDRKSGSLCSATLTTIDPKNVKESKHPLNSDLSEIDGIVAFDISSWDSTSNVYSDNFQDEFGSEIVLVIGEDYLILQFKNVDPPSRYVKNNQLRFGIAEDGMLSTLEIANLTSEQVALLKLYQNLPNLK